MFLNSWTQEQYSALSYATTVQSNKIRIQSAVT